MGNHLNPIFGLTQPAYGTFFAGSSAPMGKGGKTGQTKRKKLPGFMRTVLGANLVKLIDHHYRSIDNRTGRLTALFKESSVSVSSVQRIIDGETGASLDTLEQLSLALGVSVYQMVAPDIDAANPPVITGANEAERRLYAQWRRLAKQENGETQA
jgi:hypothetical protein